MDHLMALIIVCERNHNIIIIPVKLPENLDNAKYWHTQNNSANDSKHFESK